MRHIKIPKIGYKGAKMIFWGTVFLIIGLGNLGGPAPTQTALDNAYVILHIAPLTFWYFLATLTGVLNIVGAFWKRLEGAAFASAALFSGVFGLGYIAAWLLGHGFRAWVGGVLYLGIAFTQEILAAWPDVTRRVGKK